MQSEIISPTGRRLIKVTPAVFVWSFFLAQSLFAQAFAQTYSFPTKVDLRYQTLREDPKRNLATPGNEFGDKHGLESGTLNFNVVDVSIPGNNRLDVEFRRALKATEPRGRYGNPNMALADWEIALPRIESSYDEQTGWATTDPARPTKNCSIANKNFIASPPAVWSPDSFPVHAFWNAPKLHFPDGSGQLLVYNESVMPAPSTGGPYFWLTTGLDYVSCLSSLKNSGGATAEEQKYGRSEGYQVVRPDGTTYFFDWIALQKKTESFSSIAVYVGGGMSQGPTYTTSPVFMNQVTLAIYPTRIEDRFGNWVSYTYSNKSNEKIHLDKIESSDGRRINIAYANGRVDTVNVNGRVWSYLYGSPYASDGWLSEVRNPDQSKWVYPNTSHPPFAPVIDRLHGSCSLPSSWTGTQNPDATAGATVAGTIYRVISPSGAQGNFKLSAVMLGRSRVHRQCYVSGWTTEITGFPTNIVEPAIYLGGWTLAMTEKKVSGPGLSDRVWKYHYQSDIGFAPELMDGTVRAKVLNPEGSIDTYTYGNAYKVNEGLLLKVSRSNSGAIQRTQEFAYLVDAGSAAFPKRIGYHPYSDSNEYSSVFLRPKKSEATIQDGRKFLWEVSSTCDVSAAAPCFDTYGRPTRVVKSSSPAP